MHIILILGVSGAGKNVALGALEDIGFAVVNNLPASLLTATVEAMLRTHEQPLAISLNTHAPEFAAEFDAAYRTLIKDHPEIKIQALRLDASDAQLVKRFAETRRKHPFASDAHTLTEAIGEERARLHNIQAAAVDLDTTATSGHALRSRIRQFARAANDHAANAPLLEISSFAYRQGIPPDADLVFDARILPNPYYEAQLADLTGRDAPVIAYLDAQPDSGKLVTAIVRFVRAVMPGFIADNRARVHIGVGCTGGKHRSVYVANAVAEALNQEARVLRHDREHPTPI